MFSDEDLTVMKRVRYALDPKELSNRGKMFPGADAPALTMRGLHPLEKQGKIQRE
jgi:glycolate oxidase